MRGEGYSVDSVASAAAAATCLQSIQYALVLADWLLPGGNGIAVADQAAPLGAKTLILSGYFLGLPGGAAERHELLSKRLGHAEVVAAVRRAIGGSHEKA